MLRTGSLGAIFCVSLLSQPVLAQHGAAADAPAKRSEAERWREDLRFMAGEMPKVHRNLFHTMTRAQFEGAVKSLDERIPSLARHQIIVEMARIVAMVGDGHTNISPTRDPKIGFRAYPVQLYFFKDGLYVRAAAGEEAELVGARVLGIGSASTEKAYDAVREIIGRDNEMDARFFAPYLLAMPEVLHALGLVRDMENAPFLLEIRGRRKTVNLKPAGPAEKMSPETDASWAPRQHWVDARDGAARPVPLWLKDPRDKYWFEYLPDAKAMYVQFNEVGNKEEETVEAFAERLLAFVEANPDRTPRPRPSPEPGRQRRVQSPDPPGHRRGPEGGPEGPALHDHRPEHVVGRPDARQRTRGLHEHPLRRRAHRGKTERLRRLAPHHAAQQRDHRAGFDALVAG